jgi:hypothetical protein
MWAGASLSSRFGPEWLWIPAVTVAGVFGLMKVLLDWVDRGEQ